MSDEKKIHYCSQCGEPLTDHAKFCPECGAKVEPKQEQQSWYQTGDTYTEYTAEEATAGERAANAFENGVNGLLYFLNQTDYISDDEAEDQMIAANVPYYREKFNEMRLLNQKVSLNWSALFFGVLWMLYRKMYGVAAATIGLMIVVSCLGTAGGLLSLVLTVCCGLFGNYLYMMTIQRHVTELQKYGEPARAQYLEKYRGTSSTAVLIGIIVVGIGSIPFWTLFGLSFAAMFL